MHIRPMIRADAAGVTALYAQLGCPSSQDQILGRFDAIGASPDHGVFVAEGVGNAIVGVIHLQIARLMEADAVAMIESLVVDTYHRGQGVGSALVMEAEQWAHRQRVAILWVRSNIARTAAHTFYKRLGYERTSTSFAFRKHLPRKGGVDEHMGRAGAVSDR